MHRLCRESPELEKEMARLYRTLVREQEILEEGELQDKEAEKERAKRKGKTQCDTCDQSGSTSNG